jgi:polysaccharide biosynthesis transport protein
MRLIGTLPSLGSWRVPGPRLFRTAADSQSHYRMQDSVDSVTTILGHEMEATGARVLLVTSALEHEGKTTMAADLAASFARNGRKTLLIDSDLVRPSLHQRFGQPLVPGLSEALWKQTAPDAGIRSLPTPNLFLLAAGKADPHVMQALARDAMEPLLEQYRQDFEMIVIDSSPVLPLAHAMRISKHVDVAVLTVMNNHSVIPAVAAAHQRLTSLQVPVLGAIFIGPHVGNSTSHYSSRSSWKLLRA